MSGNRNQGSKWISRATRHRIYLRDSHMCVWCGRVYPAGNRQTPESVGVVLTLDHVIPRADGGSNNPQNLVTACSKCNRMRQGRTVEEFAVSLGPVLVIFARVIYSMTTPLPRNQRTCKTNPASTTTCAA